MFPCFERLSPTTDALHQLMNILGHDFTTDLSSSIASLQPRSFLRLKINAEICIDSHDSDEAEAVQVPPVHMGSINFNPFEVQDFLQLNFNNASSGHPRTLQSNLQASESHSSKRRKTAGAVRVIETILSVPPTGPSTPTSANSTARQLQTKPREFPQRKKKSEDGVHHLQPSSVERFVAGLWKQVFSSVELNPTSLAFREINSLCLRVAKMSRCSRALETIIQAHWVDCFEARVKNIGVEKPFLSTTETKMSALREACAILKWSEKELRNRLSIWRGYKEIKDVGGWACLVFAGSGIYRFCKYRGGFGKNLTARLGRLRPSLEVAADTIHPEWRKLLAIIGQDTQKLYSGHPHDWVVCDGMQPVALKSTYTQWYPDFSFTHIEDSVLDQLAWGRDDPRRISGTNTAFCNDCGYFQSNNVSSNECRCFPELYGACKAPVPVQVFRTPLGKNNGLIARCEFPRGSAIGEFTGLITKGMDGTDVMQSGDDERRYQIYQGAMGNYTRFINHSCAPNSRFQKFCWLGSERIILVSRGVEAGEEVTVDYSHEYWEGLDKECLCGEPCCRYLRRVRST
ncbi:SET domain-containing protein [Cadophora sp. DSE1049]|nr:SET domain-containing protein [Cadophora sp. DSE1049]